jgi:phthiocerol/phenolphthiocerol synthesis type-I polyketide synthase E
VGERGRLMGSCPAGAMVAVAADPARVDELVEARGEGGVAAVTAPKQVVLAGTPAYVERAEVVLTRKQLRFKRLRTSHAFHSALMDPVLEEFTAAASAVDLRAPSRPLYSNVTGDLLDPAQAVDPTYWASQLRQPVRLAPSLEAAASGSTPVFLEIGPGHTLAGLVRQQPSGHGAAAVGTAGPAGTDSLSLLRALAGLWEAGAGLDWERLHEGAPHRRRRLPAHPFARERHWMEAAAPAPAPEVDGRVEAEARPRPVAEAGLASEIAFVYAAAFGVESVGLDEDFFVLGGNSLVAIELIDRISQVAGAEVNLRMLYDAPRPLQLAEAIERGRTQGAVLNELATELEELSSEEVENLLSGLPTSTKEEE